jgi:hypothetical protein
MTVLSIFPGVAVTLGLAFGGPSYSPLGAAYSNGDTQQALPRIASQVTAAYASSGTATISKPADLFPTGRLVPGNASTAWSVAAVDATHATLCMAKTVTSVDDWSATVRGYAAANMTPGSTSGCTGGTTKYPFPASYPATIYAFKTLTRAAPSTAQAFKLSGLASTGVANIYGFLLLWGAPLVVTVTASSALSGTYSLAKATATEGFGVQSTCNSVPGSKSCYVFLYYAATRIQSLSSGTATLTFSTGDVLTIPLAGHLVW